MLRYCRRMRSRWPWLRLFLTWRGLVVTIFLALVIWYIVVVSHERPKPFYAQNIKEIRLGNIDFDFRIGLFVFMQDTAVYLRGSMPNTLQEHPPPVHCGQYNGSLHMCAKWKNLVKLEVVNIVEEYATCQRLTWTALSESYQPETCFSLVDANWYGGPLLARQEWPLNKASVPLQQYASQDLATYQGQTNVLGNVLDWFWFSSNGVSVIVDNEAPLKISVNQSNDKLLCLHTDGGTMRPVLKYSVCKSVSMKKAYRFISNKYVAKPKVLPEKGLFTKPIWSSYPYFKNQMEQNGLLKFTQQIQDSKLERHLLIIHDEDSIFLRSDPLDKKKFPNSHQMLMYFREYGFEVCLGTSPFVSVNDSPENKNLMTGGQGQLVEVTVNKEAANVVNLLKPSVLQWYKGQLEQMKENFGLHTFRFIGGESNFIPDELGMFTKSQFARLLTGVSEELKVTPILTFGYSSQGAGGVILLSSPSSSWGRQGGLQSIIPSVLTLGVLGYPFSIPNVVGGPGSLKMLDALYSKLDKPDEELYQRWMQVAAYMPCMMFSYPPWLYGEEMVDAAKDLIQQHEEIVAPLVLKAAREYEMTGAPIIRPMWWNDLDDPTAQVIDNQYLIADTLLVAPVLQKGATARDIYLPKGTWTDNLRQEEVLGKKWLRDYPVQLSEIATFTRVQKTVL